MHECLGGESGILNQEWVPKIDEKDVDPTELYGFVKSIMERFDDELEDKHQKDTAKENPIDCEMCNP